MKAAVIVFPGSNCDRDVQVALERSVGAPVSMIWHRETSLPALDLIVIPGGFSYGDYLRAGALAARSPVMAEVIRQAERGVAVLGICNGFQILTETGLLPGALMRNADLKFICRDVFLRVEKAGAPFTQDYRAGQVITVPIAHHDGNYETDPDTLKSLEDGDQVAFRYCDDAGALGTENNPNGSVNNIAGIFNKAGNVLGMMPHPERLAEPELGGIDGRPLFDGLCKAFGA
ncbi:phosphoribosylformylglycinamidine synthase subunit PurQ [Varunaivibrio sulfuroxidans]|uniref:Phosphoribosylformylglycinamidine synthase subunit PurQ n=1 Tax=Varunaivibrio sulfuroxidans TaxID=1773489 RepID=A0A4R3JI67_9PROT|nr:phosphoribosylformylglycinamidine synthase subunit PurQ [Varunaivibrio sulfuroxidans]TCS65073.1 phosphoribosylformylglycinamidine synthase [Varunaivibrio sulfuroxidans]WES29640.1 phosphoribosylformylglycinamidine synthase subunit PurQ [Varunaivibrio sulfuroxidans]